MRAKAPNMPASSDVMEPVCMNSSAIYVTEYAANTAAPVCISCERLLSSRMVIRAMNPAANCNRMKSHMKWVVAAISNNVTRYVKNAVRESRNTIRMIGMIVSGTM